MQQKFLLKRQYFQLITCHRLPNNVNFLLMLQESLLSVLNIVLLQCKLFGYIWVFAGQICQWYGFFKHTKIV